MTRCKCGGTFLAVPMLDGLRCDRCGAVLSGDTAKIDNSDSSGLDLSTLYSEERLRSIRGVSMSSLTIGTPSKGAISIIFPPFCTIEEQHALIYAELSVLKYAKDRVGELGLDIYSSRGKKDE